MKITLEPAQLSEVEVIIRGDVADPEVAELLRKLGTRAGGKLIVHREEEQVVGPEEAEGVGADPDRSQGRHAGGQAIAAVARVRFDGHRPVPRAPRTLGPSTLPPHP